MDEDHEQRIALLRFGLIADLVGRRKLEPGKREAIARPEIVVASGRVDGTDAGEAPFSSSMSPSSSVNTSAPAPAAKRPSRVQGVQSTPAKRAPALAVRLHPRRRDSLHVGPTCPSLPIVHRVPRPTEPPPGPGTRTPASRPRPRSTPAPSRSTFCLPSTAWSRSHRLSDRGFIAMESPPRLLRGGAGCRRQALRSTPSGERSGTSSCWERSRGRRCIVRPRGHRSERLVASWNLIARRCGAACGTRRGGRIADGAGNAAGAACAVSAGRGSARWRWAT